MSMVLPPIRRCSLSYASVRLLILSILILGVLTGTAGAEVHVCANPICWGVPYIHSDEWDEGDTFGTIYDDSECSGTYDNLHCTPYYRSLTYTVTIPSTVNLSRVVRAHIYLHGAGFDGNCNDGRFSSRDVIFVNSQQYTDCPFNQPYSEYDWDFDVNPADLVNGVNTITYEAGPWEMNPDVFGNDLYGGWTLMNDIDIRLEFTTPPKPELDGILVSPDLLVTNHDVTISPVITGESPDWEIEGVTYYVIDKESGRIESQQFVAGTTNLTYRPAGDAYGKKLVQAKLHVRDRMTGLPIMAGETEEEITIYFEKGMYPNWQDDNGDTIPNWFEYWRDDGAVPLLDGTVNYDPTQSGYGESRSGNIYLYPRGATVHYSVPININSTNLNPAGETFGGPDVFGINCTAEVLAHETYHKWVNEQWLPGGMFYNQDDIDREEFSNGTVIKNDRLPDFYEEGVSYTEYFDDTDTYNLAGIKHADYAVYGDQEYMAMRAGDGSRGIIENDWAYPGMQSGGRHTIVGSNPPMVFSCTGRCDIYSPGLPGGAPSGVTDQPVDTDANGLYNTLTAGNDITIEKEGMYEVVAVLSGSDISGPVTIAIQQNQTEYAVGTYPVSVAFPGTEISSAGLNGPYNVTFSWRHEYNENGDAPSVTWQTAAYQSTDFEPVSTGFAGAASAAPSGRDLDAAVPLVVNKAGEYTVEGYLQDPDGFTMAHAATTAIYSPGSVTAHILFDGNTITSYHRDGTYRLVKFRILDASGTVLGVVGEAGTVDISSADYGTYAPILTDANNAYISGFTEAGRYEGLSINVGIDAATAGYYTYSGTLFDAENNRVQTIKGGEIVSKPGQYSIPFNFSGKMIYNNGVSGNFTLRSLEIFGPSGSDSRSTAYTTSSYAFTDFDQPAIVVAGNISDTPVDLDNDGLYDTLRVGFDVEVGYTGGSGSDFPISANLTGSGGTLIARAGIRPQLERYQVHHVTLDFPGTSISGRGIDGPYAVTDITAGLFYTNMYHGTYDTAAYDASQFEPAAILTGFVHNDSGYPVSGTRISAMGESGYSNAAGLYRLIYGEPHQGGVLAMPPADTGLSSGYEIRNVTPGSTTYCNFTLFNYTGIFGTVTAENGTALNTGFVSASGPSDEIFNLNTWGNGSYRIVGLKNGTYTVSYIPATGADLIAAPEKGLVLTPGEVRELNFIAYTPRSLSGTVRDVNGVQVEGAEVAITEGPITATWPYAPVTEADGSYTFPELVPGTYVLNVTPPFDLRDTLVANSSVVVIALTDSSVIHDIVMNPSDAAPVAWFPDMNQTAGSAPLAISFTDNSRGYPTSWLWDFGDGSTSTDQNPVHTYTEEGTYDLTLTVSNEFGSDTAVFEDTVQVYASPRLILPSGTLEAGGSGTFPLSADDLLDASYLQLVLTYDPAVVRLDSVGNGTSFVSFIDTTIDNETGRATISIYFSSVKSFTEVTRIADLRFSASGSLGQEATLSASPADQVACTGGEGCWSGAREIITNMSVSEGTLILVTDSGPLEVAGFSADVRGGTVPLTIAFDSSYAGIESPVSWLWDFGDGSTSALPDPSHTYSTAGMYDVSLTVTNISGSGTLSRPAYITASPSGSAETYLFVTAWGHEGSGAGGEAEFLYPSGIAMHPSGNLYVCDPDNSRVQIVSPDGTYIGAFGSAGTGDGQFGNYFFGITAGPDGSVYVADIRNDRIQKFSASGSFITAWGTTGSGTGQFQWPQGISTDPEGNVYVADSANHRIQKFDSSGTFVTSWGSNGAGDGMFTYPQDVAIDDDGMIYVVETGSNLRVQKFDSDGSFISKWGAPGSGDGEFLFPEGIAVSADGGVFITDDEAFRVQKFSSDGEYLTRWGTEGDESGQFGYPMGITTDSSGKVYVVDSSNHRVEVFAPMSAGGITAGFGADPRNGTAPLTIQFTDTSTGSPATWSWDFGDGDTSADQNPSHTYTTPGSFTVSLTASGTSGADTMTKAGYITVNAPAVHEEYGPDGTDQNFDGNGDGIPDWQQDNVESLHATTGSYLTLAVSSPAKLTGVQAVTNPSTADGPAAATFPAGFLAYSIEGIAPGSSSIVKLYLPEGMTADTYYKYGPTPDNQTAHWYSFLYDGSTGAAINGSVITLHYEDGARGDSDLTENGTITDPGAPAVMVNQPPVLTAIGDRTYGEGSLIEFTVDAEDPDDSILSYSAGPIPSGAEFTNRTFSWTPSYEQAGTYMVAFNVTDPSGLYDTETIAITVTNTNRAPEIQPVEARTSAEGETIQFTVTTSDPDGDPVTLTAEPLPPGAGFTDGVFVWTPSFEQAGLYTIIFRAADSYGLTANQTAVITITDVDLNDPPVLEPIGNKNVNEGDLLQFTITAADPDGDAIVYAAGPLPAGAVFSGQEFSWVPTFDQEGVYHIVFTVSDPEGLNVTESVTVTVVGVNRPPSLELADNLTVAEGEMLQIVIAGADPDGDPVTVTAGPLPQGAVFDGSVFVWTPSYDQAGTYSVGFIATDSGGLTESKVVSVTVTDVDLNDPPILNPISDMNVSEGDLVEFVLEASDPDGDILVFHTFGLPEGAVLTGSTFTWTPDYGQAGTYKLQFVVTDPDGLSDEVQVTIVVLNTNRPPVVEYLEDRTVAEGETIMITPTASDPDGDIVMITTGILPEGAVFDGGIFSWTPTFQQAGSYTITFIATDEWGSGSNRTVTIAVADVLINNPPVLVDPGYHEGEEGSPLSFALSASDPDGDSLIYTAVSALPTGAGLSGTTFTWTPDYDQAGDYNVEFRVTDPSGLYDTRAATIAINNVNRAPEFLTIGDRTVEEGSLLSFVVSASDPDGDPLTFATGDLPEGAVFDALSREFRWTPILDQAGTYQVLFTVADTWGLSADQSVQIVVSDLSVNSPPVITAPATVTAATGSELTFTVTAVDPEGEPVTLVGEPLPDGATFENGIFTWTPSVEQAGSYTITSTATDSSGISASATTVIEVIAVTENHPPVLSPVGNRIAAAEQEIRITIQATDEDGDILTYSASPLPEGAVFSAQELVWTPSSDQAGDWQITFTVRDSAGFTDSETITLTVTADENNPPQIIPAEDLTVAEGTLISFIVLASDPDGDPLTFTTGHLPEGAVFDAQTHEFIWTPAAGQAGTYPVEFTVSDPNGLSDSETVMITVTHTQTGTWTVRIVPSVINLKSKGVFVAFITLPKPYSTNEVTAGSVTCEGATATRLVRHAKFPSVFGAVFRTSDLQNVRSGNNVPLTVRGVIVHNGTQVVFSGSDKVRVLNLKLNSKDDTEDVSRMTDTKIFERMWKDS